MKSYNNNARKREHIPKVSRHWRPVISFQIDNERLRESLSDPDKFSAFIGDILEEVNAEMTYRCDRYFNNY